MDGYINVLLNCLSCWKAPRR